MFKSSFYLILTSVLIFHAHTSDLSSKTEEISASPNPQSSRLITTFHNVGQGLCITLEFMDKKTTQPQYMLYDCGSTSFNKEMKVKESATKIPQPSTDMETSEQPSTPPISSVISEPPKSTIKPLLPEQKQLVETKSTKGKASKSKSSDDADETKSAEVKVSKKVTRKTKRLKVEVVDYKSESILNIRTSLGLNNKKIDVKLVVISHPDIDHYAWISQLFNNKNDRINSIILGGIPSDYDRSEKRGFRDFLYQIINDGTKLYFPALKMLCQEGPSFYRPLTSDKELQQILELEYKDIIWSKQVYSDPNNSSLKAKTTDILLFPKATTDFGEDFKLYFLSINPSHFIEEGDTVVQRSVYSDDSNVDSLVMKIQLNQHSVMLTGDATGITTRRIMHNYDSDQSFLNTTILSMPHHGSATHDCDDENWAQRIKPQHIIFNNGLSQKHPTSKIYALYRSLDSIQPVKIHEIWTWEDTASSGKNTKNGYFSRFTSHSIFSTLNSGTLSVVFDNSNNIRIEAADPNNSLSIINYINDDIQIQSTTDVMSESEVVAEDVVEDLKNEIETEQ